MTIDAAFEVTGCAQKLLPRESCRQVRVVVRKSALFGVRVDGAERILEVDTVLTSSAMRAKQMVKPLATRLGRHPGIHLAVRMHGAGVVRRVRRDCPVTAKPSAW
jgi:hypothetical protein